MMKRVNAMPGRAAYAVAGVAVCCLLALVLPSSALAVEPSDGTSSGSTSLTAQVPASYGVTVRVEGCGTVEAVGGAAVRHCPGPGETLIQVGHGVSQEYQIVADSGWRVDAVTYGIDGDTQTVSLVDGIYTAPALGQDGTVLRVVFVKAADGGGSDGNGADDGADDGAGDASNGNGAGDTGNGSPAGTDSNTSGTAGQANGSSSSSTRLSATGAAVSVAALMAAVLLTAGVLLLVRRRGRSHGHLD